MKNKVDRISRKFKKALAALPLTVSFIPSAMADECYYVSDYSGAISCVDSGDKLNAVIHDSIVITNDYGYVNVGSGTSRTDKVFVELEKGVTVETKSIGVRAFGTTEVEFTSNGNIISGDRASLDGYEPAPPHAGSSGGFYPDRTSIRRTDEASIYINGGSSGGPIGIVKLVQSADSELLNRSGNKNSSAIYTHGFEVDITTSGLVRSYVGDGVRIEGRGTEVELVGSSSGYIITDSQNVFQMHARDQSVIEGGAVGSAISTVGGGTSSIIIDSGATVGALSDIAISADGYVDRFDYYDYDNGIPATIISSFKGAVTNISNSGDLTGIIRLSSGEDTVVNQSTGKWTVRHFSDSNRDGIRDTVAPVAISDFGGGTTRLTNYGLIQLASNDDGSANNALFKDLATFQNSGVLSLSNTVLGDRFTIDGDYIGNNGTIRLDSQLDGDASKTDMLTINGSTSGSSYVIVTNIGGTGEKTVNGIKIIKVAGASDGQFSLIGNYKARSGQQVVVGGEYAYSLYQGVSSDPTDGNWYLRSQLQPTDPVDPVDPVNPDPVDPVEPEPLYQAGVPVYEAYPQALLGLNGVATLQQRTGNRVWSGNGNRVVAQGADAIGSPYAAPDEAGAAINGNGVWGRIEGSHNHMEPRFSTSDTNYNQNVFKMQAGIDGMLTETENGKLIGGFMVHYAHGKTKTNSAHGDGDISTDGYGLGGTLTWYGENGFYLDGQGQVTWYRSDLHSTTANIGLTDNNHGFGYALSLEGGQRFAINEAWSLTPQAQLTYSNVDFDAFTDAFDADVSLDRGESLQGRLGLTVDHENSWQNANGMLDRTRVYGIANLYYEFLQGTRVTVAESSFTSRNDRVWGGLGLGGSYNWNDDKYSIYGEGLINTSLNNFGDSYAIKGNVGFKVKW
ncbi:autotransporter outer membrane beta-barrel domain-containing protein [Brucella pseudogrignonensis]|uniref:Outer membrane autotransporter protein n=1 Tax=Brucella pseudogrignonensis TaxID=419475 RepID=A0ABU1MB31_9HYPH|nr:autotransporter outer membrane beta-barrel domain-containing protein [Brucella pseudogrignonensis]MDR6433239.1 outer membrane autotransporter protein [Brucella pseudogrignonensis]